MGSPSIWMRFIMNKRFKYSLLFLFLVFSLVLSPFEITLRGEEENDVSLGVKIKQAKLLIIQGKKVTYSSFQKSNDLNSAVSILRDICNNRSAIPAQELIKVRHDLFNVIKAIAYTAMDEETKAFTSSVSIEAENICYEFANDDAIPEEVREVAWETLATFALDKGDTRNVLEILQSMLEAFPDRKVDIGYVFFNLAKQAEKLYIGYLRDETGKGNTYSQLAFNIYEDLADNIPDSDIRAHCRMRKASFYLREGKTLFAIEEYKDILLMKNLPLTWYPYSMYNIGYIYLIRAEYDSALEYYQNIIIRYPEMEGWHVMALRKEAYTWDLKGDKEKAEQIYQRILNRYPDSPLIPTVKADLKRLYE